MLNLRNAIVSIGLMAASLLAVGLVSVSTGVSSVAASQSANLADSDDHAPRLSDVNPNVWYRSQLGECYDMWLRKLASCRQTSQATVAPYRSPIDECFDVGLSQRASCRKASQATVTPYGSPIDECFDVGLSQRANCRKASQAQLP